MECFESVTTSSTSTRTPRDRLWQLVAWGETVSANMNLNSWTESEWDHWHARNWFIYSPHATFTASARSRSVKLFRGSASSAGRTSTTTMDFFLACAFFVLSGTVVLSRYILHSLAGVCVAAAVGVFLALLFFFFLLSCFQVPWVLLIVCWWWWFG